MVILAAGGMAGVLSWVFPYPQEPFSNILLHLYIFQLHKYPSSRFSLRKKPKAGFIIGQIYKKR